MIKQRIKAIRSIIDRIDWELYTFGDISKVDKVKLICYRDEVKFLESLLNE